MLALPGENTKYSYGSTRSRGGSATMTTIGTVADTLPPPLPYPPMRYLLISGIGTFFRKRESQFFPGFIKWGFCLEIKIRLAGEYYAWFTKTDY